MPARLSRHALVAGAATCALALATAAPGIARPAGHPPPLGAHDARADPSIATGSLAGTTEQNPGLPSAHHAGLSAADDGATTLAVVLIAGGALFAGAGAGFAGGRRVQLRMH
ncbi:MAG: hypothetical protein QOH72_1859 [Solirubrobacteraceae bacterium]|jgi:hypothetical protein|nr:hypothetical protein [Solirubrobacteraceae bacterium]